MRNTTRSAETLGAALTGKRSGSLGQKIALAGTERRSRTDERARGAPAIAGRGRGTGRIVNISGIAGSSVLTSALTHGLNNAAMNHVTSYLAADLAAARVTVSARLFPVPGHKAGDTVSFNDPLLTARRVFDL